MRYLVLTADYQVSGIKDEFEGFLSREELDLPEDLWSEIEKWVADYQYIIPLDAKERESLKEEIKSLDAKGLELRKKIIEFYKGNVKVKYYSEGLLKYVP